MTKQNNNPAQQELNLGIPLQISGHRELSEAEVTLINSIKSMGASVHGMMDALKKIEGIDQRWLAIARTDLQEGFMAAVRSVARPDEF